MDKQRYVGLQWTLYTIWYDYSCRPRYAGGWKYGVAKICNFDTFYHSKSQAVEMSSWVYLLPYRTHFENNFKFSSLAQCDLFLQVGLCRIKRLSHRKHPNQGVSVLKAVFKHIIVFCIYDYKNMYSINLTDYSEALSSKTLSASQWYEAEGICYQTEYRYW